MSRDCNADLFLWHGSKAPCLCGELSYAWDGSEPDLFMKKVKQVKGQNSAKEFSCLQCGNCCRVGGYVYLTSEDIDNIAEHLGMEIREFIARYTRLASGRNSLSLTEKADGSCVFLSPESKCGIEAEKPLQCRNFPLKWRFSDAASICPGLKSD